MKISISNFLKKADPIIEIAQELGKELLKNPINEIRGYLTIEIIKDWIRKNNLDERATRCALTINKKDNLVCAFLLTDDNSILYSQNGKKIGIAFLANNLDDELSQIFSGSDSILIKLK